MKKHQKICASFLASLSLTLIGCGQSGAQAAQNEAFQQNSIGDLKALNIAGPAKSVKYEDKYSGFVAVFNFNKDGIFVDGDSEYVADNGGEKNLSAPLDLGGFTISLDGDKLKGMEYGQRWMVGYKLIATKYDSNGYPVEFIDEYADDEPTPIKTEYKGKDENGNWTAMHLSYIGAVPESGHFDNRIINRTITYYNDDEKSVEIPQLTDSQIIDLIKKAINYDTSVMTDEFASLTKKFIDNPGTADGIWDGGIENSGLIHQPDMLHGGEEGEAIPQDILTCQKFDGNTKMVIEFGYNIVCENISSEPEINGVAYIVLDNGVWKVDDAGNGRYVAGGICMEESFKEHMEEHLKKVDAEIRSGKLVREINAYEYMTSNDKKELIEGVTSYKNKYLK